jgi:hypothetical protein
MGKEDILYTTAQPCANANCKTELQACTNPHCTNPVGLGKFNTNSAYSAEPLLEDRVKAEQARAATHLKAEHEKELAQLRADEMQKKADLKAAHAQTPGGTGLVSKILGKEDPMKTAEKRQLNAEITRAEQTIKAEHAREKAELDARNAKDTAALAAAERQRAEQFNTRALHQNTAFPHNSTFTQPGMVLTPYPASAIPATTVPVAATAMPVYQSTDMQATNLPSAYTAYDPHTTR